MLFRRFFLNSKSKMHLKSLLLFGFLVFSVYLPLNQERVFAQNGENENLSTESLNEITAEEVYYRLRDNYQTQWPDDFEARVIGREIEISLSDIPEDFYEDGEPYVRYIFKRDIGDRIIVENVHPMYRNRFASHLEVYNNYRTFLDPLMDYETFILTYDWNIIMTTEHEIIIRMHDKNRGEGTYFIITISLPEYLMKSAESYNRNEFQGIVNVIYEQEGEYTYPRILDGYGVVEEESRTFRLILTDFTPNIGITEEDFVE